MQRNPSWKLLTEDATSDEGMAAKHAIVFHCFNPNGVYVELTALHAKIAEWADAHPERPNGVLMVHGSLNDFPRERLFDALNAPKRRKQVTWTIQSAIVECRNAIKHGEEFLADESKWPAKKEVAS